MRQHIILKLLDIINKHATNVREDDKEFINEIDNRTCRGMAGVVVTEEEHERLFWIAIDLTLPSDTGE